MATRLLLGDCLDLMRTLPDASVQCCVTSPPYFGLRDYGTEGQIGLEPTPDAYVARLVEVFREVRRVLTDDGTLWLNLGDSYAGSWGNYSGQNRGKGDSQRPITVGSLPTKAWDGREQERPAASQKQEGLKPKDLIGIPWRVAFALQADGWYLRSDIIWHKPNCMPESVKDRPTRAHEYLFLLTKRERYYYDADAIAEPFVATSAQRIAQPSLDTQRGGYKTEAYQQDHPGRKARDRRPADILRAMRDNGRTGRNKRDVWTICTKPYRGAHFAVMPEALVEPCILAGSRPGDTILDPFAGSGTVGAVAVRTGRDFIGCDLNADYLALASERIAAAQPPLFAAAAD